MGDPPNQSQDLSMVSRRLSGDTLINETIAVEIARLVHRATYGQADLEANEPLRVWSEGDCIIVVGSKPTPSSPKDDALDGPLAMRISKYDGQILSYVFLMNI
jgi:hypothetical protein